MASQASTGTGDKTLEQMLNELEITRTKLKEYVSLRDYTLQTVQNLTSAVLILQANMVNERMAANSQIAGLQTELTTAKEENEKLKQEYLEFKKMILEGVDEQKGNGTLEGAGPRDE
jgi:uncharacterized membrane protein YfhO